MSTPSPAATCPCTPRTRTSNLRGRQRQSRELASRSYSALGTIWDRMKRESLPTFGDDSAHSAQTRPARRPSRGGSRRGPGLSFGLIHPRPGPFTGGHPDRVRAGRGRWRTPVNADQHCWKACWGQPLASSNLASSARLTCDDALGSCSRAALHPKACVSFPVSVEPRPYVLFRTDRCGGTVR